MEKNDLLSCYCASYMNCVSPTNLSVVYTTDWQRSTFPITVYDIWKYINPYNIWLTLAKIPFIIGWNYSSSLHSIFVVKFLPVNLIVNHC